MTNELRIKDLFTKDNIVANFVRQEGIKGLWKGNVPAEILYVLYGASQFTAYSFLNEQLLEFQQMYNFQLRPLLHSFIAGSGAGAAATIVAYPFDLLRTKLAANRGIHFLSMTETCKKIMKEHGPLAFFAGLRPSLLSIVANLGLFFWLYSLARTGLAKMAEAEHTQIHGVEAVSGLIAGVTAKTVGFPLDTLRKRVQMSHQSNTFGVFLEHYRKHGLMGFYRGFLVSLVKNAPTSAISVFVYEYTITTARKLNRLANA